ncbi:hypothetical protein SROCM77S_06171 [Streptomyces rochei]
MPHDIVVGIDGSTEGLAAHTGRHRRLSGEEPDSA